MACDITKGRVKECKQNLGGQSKLYMFNYQEDPFTVLAGEATAINVGITVVYVYELEGTLNTLSEDMVSDKDTGVTVNTQTTVMTLRKQDAPTSAEFNLLAYGDAQCVVKDRNGVYHALGISEGLNWSINAQTGGNYTDLNGYTVTGVATEGALSPKLDAATITALDALV
jgi:hypothetical protein